MKTLIRQKTQLPMIVALICAGLLIGSIFLPYVTAAEDYREWMEATGQKTTLSLFDFASMFLEEGEMAFPVILAILGGLTAIAVLLAIFRKPIGMMIFDMLAAGLVTVIHLIFASEGNLAGGYFNWAVGNTLMFAACALFLVCAVWMLVCKRIAGKNIYSCR